jgi:outer membrane protein TolC
MQPVKSILVAALLLVASCVQATVNLATVDEARTYALAHNYGQKKQQLNSAYMREQQDISEAYLYPSLSATMAGQYNIDIGETPVPGELVGKPGETVYTTFGKAYTYTAGLNVTYNLLNWTSIYKAKTAAARVKLAEANNRYYTQQLNELVGQTYYAAITSVQAEKLWEQSLQASDTLLILTRKKMEEGISDQFDLNQALLNKLQLAQQVERTKAYTNDVLKQLKTLLGMDYSEQLVFSEVMEPLEIGSTGTRTIASDRKSDAMKQEVEVARLETKSALAGFTPQLSIKGSFGANQFSNDFNFSLQADDWHQSNYVGVSMSIPLFNGFANKSTYEAAKIQQQLSQTAYQEELIKAQLETDNLIGRYHATWAVVQGSYEKINLSHENLQLAREKYEQGLFSFNEYLTQFQSMLSIQSQFLSDLSDFRLVKATIDSRN